MLPTFLFVSAKTTMNQEVFQNIFLQKSSPDFFAVRISKNRPVTVLAVGLSRTNVLL